LYNIGLQQQSYQLIQIDYAFLLIFRIFIYSPVTEICVRPTPRAGLTIRHGTHVRRATGWKGAPKMTCSQNFEHTLFFEMSPEKVMSKFLHAKIDKRSIKRGPQMAATVNYCKTLLETAGIHW